MEIEGNLDRYHVLKEPELEEQADSLVKRIQEQFEVAPRLEKAYIEKEVNSSYNLDFEKQFRPDAKAALDCKPLDVDLGEVGQLTTYSQDLRMKVFLMPSLLLYLLDSYWYDSSEHYGYSFNADALLYGTIHHKGSSLQDVFTNEQRCLISETFLFISQHHWCSNTRTRCKRILDSAGWNRYLACE